mmetsp:Transcript_22056/g.41052  ORF Transcript_22056/g.41052 Transcript_22056/m.41052 type:complete len:845 (-) Transcript_22056:225-2759(-)
MDEDGFEAHYDVVLSGTGLVQSILSAALSKRGKKVLHLDKNDFYGGDYHATHTLTQFLELCSKRKEGCKVEVTEALEDVKQEEKGKAEESLSELCSTFEKRGCTLLPESAMSSTTWLEVLQTQSCASLGCNSSNSSEISLVECSESCGVDVVAAGKAVTPVRSVRDGSPVCRGYQMEHDPSLTEQQYDSALCHPSFFGYRCDHQPTVNRMICDSRCFQIDSNPKLLLSAGKMVDAIISSGVGHYLEFKPVEKIFYVASKSANKKVTVSSNADEAEALSASAALLKLWQVPCCKKDIFNTKLFTALEKRALMKLMQFAVDHGRDKDGLPVTTLNENELAQGRSLFRPQNKLAVPVGKGAVEEAALDEKCFADFLSASTVPSRLQEFVTHALCLDPRPAALVPRSSEGLDSMYRHVNASGRYGETSFLIPVYGTSEFAQAYCRLSAVWGGIFLLRESLSKVLTADVPSTPVSETGGTSETSGSGEEKEDSGSSSNTSRVCAVKLSNNKYMKCDHLVCDEKLQHVFAPPRAPSSTSENRVRLVQRQMVLRRPFLSPALCSGSGDGNGDGSSTRGVCVFPANTPGLDNSHAVYLLQLDESTQVSPRGTYLSYLMTYIPCSMTGGGGGGDEEEHKNAERADRAKAAQLMNRTTLMLQSILAATISSGEEQKQHEQPQEDQEIFFATFLHPSQPASALSTFTSRNSDNEKCPPVTSSYDNVHLCDNSSEQVLYVHDAVCQAEALFKAMYPSELFLEDTEENNAAQTRYIPDDDDDGLGAILSSAEQAMADTVIAQTKETPASLNEEGGSTSTGAGGGGGNNTSTIENSEENKNPVGEGQDNETTEHAETC